jgi:hypothetical protein
MVHIKSRKSKRASCPRSDYKYAHGPVNGKLPDDSDNFPPIRIAGVAFVCNGNGGAGKDGLAVLVQRANQPVCVMADE